MNRLEISLIDSQFRKQVAMAPNAQNISGAFSQAELQKIYKSYSKLLNSLEPFKYRCDVVYKDAKLHQHFAKAALQRHGIKV